MKYLLKNTGSVVVCIPAKKDDTGSETWNDEGIMQQAVRFIKKNYPNLYVITDVCFLSVNMVSHGHCGIIHNHGCR
ncbi:MAG: hypothetical protein R2821_13220 [Flavobacteriaceae bacterium]